MPGTKWHTHTYTYDKMAYDVRSTAKTTTTKKKSRKYAALHCYLILLRVFFPLGCLLLRSAFINKPVYKLTCAQVCVCVSSSVSLHHKKDGKLFLPLFFFIVAKEATILMLVVFLTWYIYQKPFVQLNSRSFFECLCVWKSSVKSSIKGKNKNQFHFLFFRFHSPFL